ncbi:MAG: hypothetical protein OEZ58_17640 [Gammaproteobacteria bacterium]|nr:hypothetical protein [Gammaproteobacteria bacterium]MDH5730815.1 hypothetical protein [Gammaproteobacteria bacterium]
MDKLAWVLAVFFILVMLSACTTVSERPRHKLSEVMGKAANDYEGPRAIESQDSVTQANDDVEASDMNTDTGSVVSSTNAEDEDSEPLLGGDSIAALGFERGHGFISRDKYSSHNSYYISVGFDERKQWQSALYLGYASIAVNAESTLYQSVSNNLSVLSFGVKAKHLWFEEHTRLRPYLSWGAAASYLLWKYNNPILSESGNSFQSDSVAGMTLLVGAGLAIEPAKFMRIYIEFSPTLHLWGETTRLNYENDVFPVIGLFDTNISVNLFF